MENNEKQFEPRGERKSWGGRGNSKPRRDWNSSERPFNRDRKSFNRDSKSERPRFSKSYDRSEKQLDERETRSFGSRRFNNKPRRQFDDNKDFEQDERREFKPRHFEDRPRRQFDAEERQQFSNGERKPFRKFNDSRNFKPKRFDARQDQKFVQPTEYTSIDKNLITRNFDDEWNDEDLVVMDSVPQEEEIEFKRPATETEGYRLNRFISAAGVCSRRAADDYIAAGRITVNGKKVVDFSTKVFPGDEVCLDGKKLASQKRVYIVFNKPKDCISTKSDPEGRKTIFDYVKTDVEVENVGRLDRNTTGVMLLTNDGDLIERLTHPRYNKMKIYHVFLNKNLSNEDFESIRGGVDFTIESENGEEPKKVHVDVDDLQYVEGEKNQVGIQIHSGMNRVVRRIFEKFGYEVEKLDRVYFAGLTKKDLPRGHWRYLTQKEVGILKRGAYA